MSWSFRRLLVLVSALLVCALFGTPRAAQTADAKGRTAVAKRAHAALSLFTHSENCMACHNNLQSPSGEDVSIGATWRSTMMANSGRDPYWQAGVRREVLDHPAQADAIQAECAACHMPMLQKVSKAAGKKTDVFAQLPINKKDDSELHKLAADGVSCTVCHQISDEGLGTRE